MLQGWEGEVFEMCPLQTFLFLHFQQSFPANRNLHLMGVKTTKGHFHPLLFQADPQSSPFPAEHCPVLLSLGHPEGLFWEARLQNKQVAVQICSSLAISHRSDQLK